VPDSGTTGLATANVKYIVKAAHLLTDMPDTSWFWESWRGILPAPWDNLLLALASILCGIILGSERQRREKPAGLRTMALICLGSAVFTMLSFAVPGTTIMGQTVTGIGFLGAGVILHGRRMVSGMTTAALIWISAAIGMTVGSGYVLAGWGLSILVNLLLVVIFFYETRWHPDLHNTWVTLEYAPKGGLTRIRLERVLVEYNLPGISTEWTELSKEISRLKLNVRLARVHLYELLGELAEVPEVTALQQTSSLVHAPNEPSK